MAVQYFFSPNITVSSNSFSFRMVALIERKNVMDLLLDELSARGPAKRTTIAVGGRESIA